MHPRSDAKDGTTREARREVSLAISCIDQAWAPGLVNTEHMAQPHETERSLLPVPPSDLMLRTLPEERAAHGFTGDGVTRGIADAPLRVTQRTDSARLQRSTLD